MREINYSIYQVDLVCTYSGTVPACLGTMMLYSQYELDCLNSALASLALGR